jgi:eukaryotic-like serine/threonine-protein kinase
MRRLPEGVVRKPATAEDHQRLIIGFANELCETIASLAPEKRHDGIKAISDRFAGSMPVSERLLKEVLDDSFTELKQVAVVLQANLRQSQLVRHLHEWVGGESAEQKTGDPLGDTLLEDSAIAAPESAAIAEDAQALAQSILTAGIQDISNSLVEERSLNDILRIILETMYRAMGFKRVLLCLRDLRTQAVVGRFGFGPDASEMAKHFRIPVKPAGDVFSVAISKALDIIISDVGDAKIAERVPEWYRQHVTAQTFVLLPLSLKGAPVGLIYCDKDLAGSIRIGEKELALLKTLRNQALLAIKQSA